MPDLIMDATEMRKMYDEKWYEHDIIHINQALKDMLEDGYNVAHVKIKTQSAVKRLKEAGFRVIKYDNNFYDISFPSCKKNNGNKPEKITADNFISYFSN